MYLLVCLIRLEVFCNVGSPISFPNVVLSTTGGVSKVEPVKLNLMFLIIATVAVLHYYSITLLG